MSDRNDRFDVLLDKVLGEENAVEPLVGLEKRMMARVREGSLASRRWRFAAWAGGLGLAAAVAVLVVLLPGRHEVRHDSLAVSNQRGLASRTEKAAVKGIGSGEIPSAAKAALSNDGLSMRLKSRPFKANARAEMERVSPARDEEARLPKLDVFPSPAPADVFPAPVAGGQDAAVESLSPKAAEALLALQKEQKEAIQIAAIVIAPLDPER